MKPGFTGRCAPDFPRPGVHTAISGLNLGALTGCPLPFDYSGGRAGSSQTTDPSSPKANAAVEVSNAGEGGTSGTIPDKGELTLGRTTAVTLSTATDNAFIYYTDDGNPITDVNAAKKFRGSSVTITVARTASRQSLVVHTVAIGPNMVPSAVVKATVAASSPPVDDIDVSLQVSGTFEPGDFPGTLPATATPAAGK